MFFHSRKVGDHTILCFCFSCVLRFVSLESQTVDTESKRKTPKAHNMERKSASSEKKVVIPADTKKDRRKQVLFLCSKQQDMINKITVQRKSTEIFKNTVMSKPQKLLLICVFVYPLHTRVDYTSLLHKCQYPFLVFLTKKLLSSTKSVKKTKKTR